MKRTLTDAMFVEAEKKSARTKTPITEINFDAKTLEEFGFKFNADEKLVRLDDSPFAFVNQKHYEKLGDLIVQEIYEKMQAAPYNLNEIMLPLKDPLANSPIFVSNNYKTCEILVVLLCGSGAVRAGQWARSLCANESLKEGSQLSYIKRCLDNGWGVVVLNHNQVKDKNDKYLKHVHSNYSHFEYVWDELLAKLPFQKMMIVAHSYGGCVTLNLLKTRRDSLKRLVAIAFTDSVHSVSAADQRNKELMDKLHDIAINWVRSDKALDKVVSPSKEGCRALSAGHQVHEWTSHSAIDSVFAFLQRKSATRMPTRASARVSSRSSNSSSTSSTTSTKR